MNLIYHCHVCNKQLQQMDHDLGSNYNQLECPDVHASVTIFGTQITGYTLYWDEDDKAETRYKLIRNGNKMTLYRKAVPPGRYYHNTYMFIPQMTIDPPLPLIIKDNKIQVGNLVHRLLRLKAFA